MAAPAGNPQQLFLSELVAHGHFLPSGEPGIYGRGAAFELVRTALDDLITRVGAGDRPERPRFPPVIPRRILEQVGYLKSFPQLCGCVFSFGGSRASALDMAERAERGEDWSGYLSATNVALVPAACYPAYPAIAQRGPLDPGGVTLDLGGCYVFRNEPSQDPARLQMFHQRELVRIGEADAVFAWRETWMDRARTVFEQIGLEAKIDTASDPFFGREGKLLANSQRQQGLKFEALVPIASAEPTAVSSFNLHQEHFGATFGIRLHGGGTASSSCVGFGLERITLALFRAHGMDAAGWPRDVRNRLWPESGPAAAAR
jgi:seryl-tRNA synthetase